MASVSVGRSEIFNIFLMGFLQVDEGLPEASAEIRFISACTEEKGSGENG